MSKLIVQRSKAADPAAQNLQVGGPGNDVFYVNDSSEVVLDSSGADRDVVYASVNWVMTAGSHIEVLSTVSQAATTALQLTGNEFANEIYGNAGTNFLDGGGGADYLMGFAGDDVYIVDNGGDVVAEAAGGGRDVVYTQANYVLTAGAEVEILSALSQAGTAPLELTGNGFANEIYGTAGNNFIDGGGGADYLMGFGGDDVYIVDHAGDVVVEATGGGRDVVYARSSYVLTAGSEVEILSVISQGAGTVIDLTGNERVNELYGNTESNFLDGGGGADYLRGFGGNDVYIVDSAADVVAESAGEGSRDVIYARASYTMAAGVDVEVLSVISQAGGTAIDLTGNELANELYGNTDSNFLDGGGGADYLRGFAGNDSYVVDNAGDFVAESAGEGSRDVVFARTSYTLAAGADVEVLSTISSAATTAIDLTGNALANEIYGNAGANRIDGGAGADYLVGNGGADTFAFTTALGGGNVDQIADFSAGDDLIQLSGAAGQPFAALASGTLAAGAFVIGSAAAQADDYILYNSATGALLYDADGNGAGAAVQFATLATGLSLTAANFVVSGPANNAPAFSSGGTASVAENSPASTIVYQAAATDADGDRITWSLSGADASLLTIDANGAVRLISSPDFEIKASYSFNVVASDSAVSTPKAVTLTIIDVADASTPIINETAAANDSVGTAQALDRGTFTIAPNGNLFNPSLPSATVQGSVSVPGDKDFFSITLQAGELLVLDVDINPANGLDSFLTLYNSNGIPIGDNDDLVSADPGSGTQFGHNTDSQIRFRAATSGTYYFSIESFNDEQGPTSSGAYNLNVSIGPPATAQQLIQEDVDALVSGESWNHLNLTYGFPTMASQYPSNPKEVQNGFTPFTGTQQTATSLIVQLIANVTPLTFQQLIANPGTADLRYAMSNEPDVAYAYYPTNGGPSSLGGTAWFNHNSFNNPLQGNYAWMGILHETGHALGLKHGHEFPVAISADRDSVEYSVMTYRSYPGQDLSGGGGYTNETTSYPQTLMMYDIAALQQIYGANFGFSSGDSVYTWNPLTGQMRINGAVATTPAGNHVFLTVWDGGGNDTYDLSNYTASDTLGSPTIDLRPGEWSTISQVQIANLGQGHQARGNVANALLYQGNTASLIENASGSQTSDTIIANQVANHLTGNGGADTFKWTASTDSTAGAQADTIMDFVSGTDHIDLSAIDANPATGGNDAFAFIGTSAFHNVAGELRYDVSGGSAHIFADLDGNGVADMEIIVSNVTTLAGADFVL